MIARILSFLSSFYPFIHCYLYFLLTLLGLLSVVSNEPD